MIDQKIDYIHYNTMEAGIVESAEDKLYSSAKNYAGEKDLLKIEL